MDETAEALTTESSLSRDERALARDIRDYLRGNERLLNGDYSGHPLAGHCYVASETYFHLNGGYDRFYVCRVPHESTTHWFLECRDSGEIVDLTVDQFDTEPPYDARTRTGFMTTEPSERAETVIQQVS